MQLLVTADCVRVVDEQTKVREPKYFLSFKFFRSRWCNYASIRMSCGIFKRGSESVILSAFGLFCALFLFLSLFLGGFSLQRGTIYIYEQYALLNNPRFQMIAIASIWRELFWTTCAEKSRLEWQNSSANISWLSEVVPVFW